MIVQFSHNSVMILSQFSYSSLMILLQFSYSSLWFSHGSGLHGSTRLHCFQTTIFTLLTGTIYDSTYWLINYTFLQAILYSDLEAKIYRSINERSKDNGIIIFHAYITSYLNCLIICIFSVWIIFS